MFFLEKQRILILTKLPFDYNNYYKNFPWKRTLNCIRTRCNNLSHPSSKNYGKKGIECRITEEELKFLWFRDKAYEMDKPSIDRIENNGHYELGNCQYIEKSENSKKSNNKKRKPILQYDLQGNFIAEWDSYTNASLILKKDKKGIWMALKGKYKQAYGFIWKYKNVK